MFVYSASPISTAGTFVAKLPAKLRSKQKLLRALATKLRFPDYFGENWDALDECLGDLSWLGDQKIDLIHSDLPLLAGGELLPIYLSILRAAQSRRENLTVIFPAATQTTIEAILARDE